MINPDTDVTYHVVYQDADRSGEWFTFTNDQFEHKTLNGWSYTTDLAEAEKAANDLVAGRQFTDSRPKYRHPVTAAQVYQTITTGGVIRTFGTPTEKESDS